MIVSFVLNHPGSILDKETKREEYIRIVLKGIKHASRIAHTQDLLLPMNQKSINLLSSLFPFANMSTSDHRGYIHHLISEADPRFLYEEWESKLNCVLFERKIASVQAFDLLRHFRSFLQEFTPTQIISIQKSQLTYYFKYIEQQQSYSPTVAVMALQLFYQYVLHYIHHVIYSFSITPPIKALDVNQHEFSKRDIH